MSADLDYPRPDFQRTQLHWESLDGPWDFLFDDEDVGLSERWQYRGLPDEVTLQADEHDQVWDQTEADKITQQTAAFPDKISKDNTRTKSQNARNTKRSIIVPYVFQCPASGINERTAHEVLWYERRVKDLRTDEARQRGDRLIVRFGAVDYVAQVWVDGQFIASHRGGHVPFDIDITDVFHDSPELSKRLTLRVFDSTSDLTQPRGKQYWGSKPESIFYTPSSGIWQSVWLEVVPAARIAESSQGTILRSDDIENGLLHARIAVSGRRAGQRLKVQVAASIAGKQISQSEMKDLPRDADIVSIDLAMHIPSELFATLNSEFKDVSPQRATDQWHKNVALWSPSHPHLYDITIRLFSATPQLLDEVNTTTGMRSISWQNGDGTFRLNNKPIFQALTLDQGYWLDTFMTPPNRDALKKDIQDSKAMGFNGCRKHQKVEAPLFAYWADRLGFLVWGEMANAYSFSAEYATRFTTEWLDSVRRDINHPCIVAWTPVNESWGYTALASSLSQRNHIRELYYATKSLDPTRPINDNCGWEHVVTDMTTFHDYADGPVLAKTCETLDGILSPKSSRAIFTQSIAGSHPDPGSAHAPGAPILCTEFAGINIATAALNPDKDSSGDAANTADWGYTTASSPTDLLARIRRMMLGIVEGGHICGFVYTQFADIEQEANGLYTAGRVAKLEVEEVREVVEEAERVYFEKLEERMGKGREEGK